MALTPEQFDRAQPKYTPTHTPVPGQKAQGMMIEVEGIDPAPIPGQRIMGTLKDPENPGHRIQVSVPHLPYERWIDEAGNVLSAVIRTNRVQKKVRNDGRPGGSTDDGNFHAQITKARRHAGWVRYDDGENKPSTFVDVNGKTVRVDEWTPEVRDALIAARRKEQGDMMRYEEKPWLDKMKRESESVQKALTEALSSFADGAKQRDARSKKLAELDK